MIKLIYERADMEELLKTLKVMPKGLERATSRAINKTLTSTRAYMVKLVREDYAVKAKDVRSELHIQKANWSTLFGSVHGAGSPGIPLLTFVRGSKKTPSTRRLRSGAYRPPVGVPVLIRKDKGKMPAKGVFLAKMQSGHIGAFKRIDSMLGSWWNASKGGKEKIREVYGPSPIKILASDRYDEQLDDFVEETMDKNLHHEADYLIQKMGLR